MNMTHYKLLPNAHYQYTSFFPPPHWIQARYVYVYVCVYICKCMYKNLEYYKGKFVQLIISIIRKNTHLPLTYKHQLLMTKFIGQSTHKITLYVQILNCNSNHTTPN